MSERWKQATLRRLKSWIIYGRERLWTLWSCRSVTKFSVGCMGNELAQGRRPSMRRTAVAGRSGNLAIFGCLVIATTLGACREDAASGTAAVRPVRTQLVEIIEWKQAGTAIGEIKPRYEADIGFRIAGKVAARPVDVGTVLASGAIIATLDSTNEQTAVRIAETDVSRAQAELDDAMGQDARQRELLRRGFTTQANYDATDRRLKTAKARLESAQLGKRDAVERLGYTELKSDGAGLVTAVGAQVGQVVGAAQMVVRVARTDAKEAEFKVAERTLRSVPSDSVVEVSLLSNPNIKALGHVREIATTADPITRTFAVRIDLDNPPEPMRFGATVQGRVVLEEKRVVQLPSSALFQLEGSPAVWIFDPSTSTVNPRHLMVLRYESDQVLVSDGLARGEHVVVAGVHKLWTGMKVRLM
jgi:RND family efflux transporter MFP subunit